MDKLGDLYPAFQNALMDNGNLVGWYVDAQPWGGALSGFAGRIGTFRTNNL